MPLAELILSTGLRREPIALSCLGCETPLVPDQGLAWCEECGIGRSVRAFDAAFYDEMYAQRYESYAGTVIGDELNLARWALLHLHCQPIQRLLDYGCGVGTFLAYCEKAVPSLTGIDVNPVALRFARSRCHRSTLIQTSVDGLMDWARTWDWTVVTYWDTFEHLADPLTEAVWSAQWIALSLPIYRDQAHCRASKHCKPTEHLGHYTARGLTQVVDRQGFDLVVHDAREQVQGREDIETFLFRRREA